MAEHYKDSEKELLIRDIGLLWGRLPSRSQQNNATVASATAFSGKLTNRNVWINAGGLPGQFSDGDADGNIHHWGAFLVYGFAEENQASAVNTLRELIPNPGSSLEDIRLGNVAVNSNNFLLWRWLSIKTQLYSICSKRFRGIDGNQNGNNEVNDADF